MAKTGRPQIPIDWSDFDKLCAMQCTQQEIASFLEISIDTLDRAVKRKHGVSFAVIYEEKRAKGRISLRRAMFQKALTGQPALMIFLAKNYLGMSDKVENTLTTSTEAAKKLIINFGEAKEKLNAVEKGLQQEDSGKEHSDGNESG